MSVLTTSQLTFCDLKDSYSIHMDTDCIGLACNNNGTVLESQTITIKYRALMGSARVEASCDITDFPSGVTASSTPTSSGQDGTIVLNVDEMATLGNQPSSNIKVVFTINDSEKFTFEKYITFVKYMVGASGEDGITFKIYSNQGFIFKEGMNEIELKVAAFKGGQSISDATYTWSWWDNSIGNYSIIESDTTSLLIDRSDVFAYSNLKCVMTYNGIEYEDHIVLSNETVIYTSVVKFFDGSNIFTSNDLYIVAYVDLYKNNDRIETISANTYCNGISSVSSDGIITSSVTGDFTEGYQMYFICNDDNGLYTAILGEYTSTGWIKVNYSTVYRYNNTLYPNHTNESNIIVISKESINKSRNIDFTISKEDGSYISSASTMVIDSNDPVVSNNPPENPSYNQLWLDTSTSPSTLKIYTKKDGESFGEWVVCSEQLGRNVYTSQPNSYLKGDLWILADGETCERYDSSGNYIGDFGSGSMLKAKESSDTFAASHWEDADAESTEVKNNIKQYFDFNADTGLRVGRKDEKFYVNISSDRMGFFDNSDPNRPRQEVVYIGNSAATIRNLNVEGIATFDCPVMFNQDIQFGNFILKLESNGSLSLATK